jgi:hypothetical protein
MKPPTEYRETSHPSPRPRRSGRARAGAWTILVALASSAAALATACLDRPLCDEDCRPKTTNVFVTNVQPNNVDKIDLHFMID